jgi:hypothetical protein
MFTSWLTARIPAWLAWLWPSQHGPDYVCLDFTINSTAITETKLLTESFDLLTMVTSTNLPHCKYSIRPRKQVILGFKICKANNFWFSIQLSIKKNYLDMSPPLLLILCGLSTFPTLISSCLRLVPVTRDSAHHGDATTSAPGVITRLG